MVNKRKTAKRSGPSKTNNEPPASEQAAESSLMLAKIKDVLMGREAPPYTWWFFENRDNINEEDMIRAYSLAGDFIDTALKNKKVTDLHDMGYVFVYANTSEICRSSQALQSLPKSILAQLLMQAMSTAEFLGKSYGFSKEY
jgi:hypothetical protein